MAEGQMRCSGSSLFLKSRLVNRILNVSSQYYYRYGVGYHMVVTKEENCDSHAVIDCVTSTIPGGEMVNLIYMCSSFSQTLSNP